MNGSCVMWPHHIPVARSHDLQSHIALQPAHCWVDSSCVMQSHKILITGLQLPIAGCNCYVNCSHNLNIVRSHDLQSCINCCNWRDLTMNIAKVNFIRGLSHKLIANSQLVHFGSILWIHITMNVYMIVSDIFTARPLLQRGFSGSKVLHC